MADRTSSAILLDADGDRFLLDAGEPCAHKLKALDVKYSSIDAIFISHGHSDHTAGLMMLVQGTWLEARRRPLPIYIPQELIAPLRAWLDASYLPEKLVGFPIEYIPWERGGPTWQQGKATVTINPTTHLDSLRSIIEPEAFHRFLPYSIAFDWPDRKKRLVYSADIGRPQDMDGLWVRPADLLICELAHFTPKDLFTYLQDKPIRRLVLTHPTTEFSAQIDKIVAMGQEMLPEIGSIQAVRDGDRVEF